MTDPSPSAAEAGPTERSLALRIHSRRNSTGSTTGLKVLGRPFETNLDKTTPHIRSTVPEIQLGESLSASDNLCTRCREINLEEVFQVNVSDPCGSIILNLNESVEQLKAADCAMCRLLGAMSPEDFGYDGEARDKKCQLRAFSAKYVCGNDLRVKNYALSNVNVLAVICSNDPNPPKEWIYCIRDSLKKTGYICLLEQNEMPPKLPIRQLNLQCIDVRFIKHWMAHCLDYHHKRCATTGLQPTKFFRVIDCHRREVITAPPTCNYVALSYVWGPNTSDSQIADDAEAPTSTLQHAPKVILQSIEVTKDLGFNYLWVDRYCIDQTSASDKHHQIRQMDAIYAEAQLTIIAAAGEGPDYGLPGVGGTKRKYQPTLRIGNRSLISSLPDPSWATRNSKWGTRGWTYQEGLLSKRRLIFTEEQVCFECNEMHCSEVLDLTYDKDRYTGGRITRIFPPIIPGEVPQFVMTYISEYYQRQLSYPEDTINAITGILKRLSNSKPPLHSFTGIPVLQIVFDPLENECITTGYRTAYFILGLLWKHRRPGKRRACFPSWSWAGWEDGALADDMLQLDESERYLDVKIWIEDGYENVSPYPDRDRLQDCLSQWQFDTRYLHVEAPALDISAAYLDLETILNEKSEYIFISHSRPLIGDGFYISFQISGDTSFLWKISCPDLCVEDWDKNISSGRMKKSLVAVRMAGDNKVLLLQKTGSVYERRGICNMSVSRGLVHNNQKDDWRLLVDYESSLNQRKSNPGSYDEWKTHLVRENNQNSDSEWMNRAPTLPWETRTVRIG